MFKPVSRTVFTRFWLKKMPMSKRFKIFAALAAALVLAGCAVFGSRVVTEVPAFSNAKIMGHLADPMLSEVSGLAASRRDPAVLWAVNDSGNPPYLYAMRQTGQVLARFEALGIPNNDWEDMAAFMRGKTPMLLVADVGDNREKRENGILYLFKEPKVDLEKKTGGHLVPDQIVPFVFEGGPVDCEAVAVDERDLSVWLISKRSRPPLVFRLSLPEPGDNKIQTAKKEGFLPLLFHPGQAPDGRALTDNSKAMRPTAADISTQGNRLLILTYAHAFLFTRTGSMTWPESMALGSQPLWLPDLPQAEAACLDPSGRVVHLTSEGSGSPVLRIDIP